MTALKQKPVAVATIFEIKDGNVVQLERDGVGRQPIEEISIGLPCFARGRINLYQIAEELKMFAVACYSCTDNPLLDGECKGCFPEGVAP